VERERLTFRRNSDYLLSTKKKRSSILFMFYNKYFSLMMTFQMSKHVALNDIYIYIYFVVLTI